MKGRIHGIAGFVGPAIISTLALAACQGEQRAASGVVVVESAPEDGALVKVGVQEFGVTPCEIRGLPSGPIYLTLEREGYHRTSHLVEVPPSGEARVTVPLAPLSAHISINSIPEGADVWLDGSEYLGKTPLRDVTVRVGQRSYTLRMENYEPLTETLTVETDFVYTKAHRLTPLPAEVQVISRPSGAAIYINGEKQPALTPAKFTLPPETYTINVHTKGYIEAERTVVLGPNAREMLDLVLEPGYVPPGMVLIPAGEFIRGSADSPDERPMEKVFVDAFYMDKFEVTNEQFREIFPAHRFEPGQEQLPVRGVTWKQAVDYAQAVGKRLPTELEWEKAARGEDGRVYPWGNKLEPNYANMLGETAIGPKRVGSHRLGASPYGCMDMAGNVYEWTSDWYQPYPGNKDIRVEYGQVYRVLRGGSYKSDAFDVRAARRKFDYPDTVNPEYGFRCAMDIAASEAPRRGGRSGAR